MKKFNLLVVALLGLTIGLTSCNPIEDPIITVDQSEVVLDLNDMEAVLISGKIEIDAKDTFEKVTITCTYSNAFTYGLEYVEFNPGSFSFSYTANDLKPEEQDMAEMKNITVYVKTANKEQTKTVDVTVNAVQETQLVEEAFEWKRVASAAGEGLEQFGLQWTGNAKEIMCVIKPLGDTKLVELTNAYADIVTLENLKEIVDGIETGLTDFRGVSATVVHNDYDFVLATKVGEEYYLINIKNNSIVVDPIHGTTITINGNYKTAAPEIVE
ncbi:hypothetical protein LJC25_05745 [Bacteroidales bacterium OttesenSCG-928-K03]|nr:hypothetical protein [Bacteroidales bacterium OttesenSCG-928-L14]MDL2240933.1 hypothetical protein [Bacteroidales bacterium OttesenSCG-928-K22]MDL2243212.1 hypothetical protein [Bacteroidales bacterium OttesenSCG-928-K03]